MRDPLSYSYEHRAEDGSDSATGATRLRYLAQSGATPLIWLDSSPMAACMSDLALRVASPLFE